MHSTFAAKIAEILAILVFFARWGHSTSGLMGHFVALRLRFPWVVAYFLGQFRIVSLSLPHPHRGRGWWDT